MTTKSEDVYKIYDILEGHLVATRESLISYVDDLVRSNAALFMKDQAAFEKIICDHLEEYEIACDMFNAKVRENFDFVRGKVFEFIEREKTNARHHQSKNQRT